MTTYFNLLRPKQWVKNLFILLPLIFGQKLFSFPENLRAVFVFGIFSLASSAGYILNDIFDRNYDRTHPVKRLRPVASGKVSVQSAWIICVLLAFSSIGLSFGLGWDVALVLLTYMGANLLYTLFFKRLVLIDVFCLALFTCLRIVAGTVVTGVIYSHWMIIMAVLLALFLGFQKRRNELGNQEETGTVTRPVLYKYSQHFIDQVVSVLTSSIVVTYMLYTFDKGTVDKIGSTHLMYSIPFVYYGVFRYLYIIHKLGFGEDPTVILFIDRMTQLNLLLWLIVCTSVIYLGF